MRRSDFRLDLVPADQGQSPHDRRPRIRADAAARLFVTTARGFIHDEAALYEALRDKRIAGAGLDVWDKEPPPPDHPLLQFDNVLASPHTAGVTREARINMGKIAAEQTLDALDGKRPPRIDQSRGVAGLCEALRADVRIYAEIGRHSAKTIP